MAQVAGAQGLGFHQEGQRKGAEATQRSRGGPVGPSTQHLAPLSPQRAVTEPAQLGGLLQELTFQGHLEKQWGFRAETRHSPQREQRPNPR